MVIVNPKILFFDISFQLSFLATYGLIVFSPYLEKKMSFLPTFFAVRSSAVATIAAQIMVVPLIIYAIGEFSIISPLVNVLVLFAVPISMLLGFLTALCGMLLPIIAPFLGLLSTYLLKYQLSIVEIFSELPFAHIALPPFHWVWMIALYILIFFWIQRIKKKQIKI
ncbi:MAG: competence protein ComEC [Crocinitomicaceae bacterium]|jgi:competence protein ComEC